MNINLNKREQKLLTTAREFTKEMVVPNAMKWELERKLPLDVLKVAADKGLLCLAVPEDYGGQGISFTAITRILEEIASGCMFFGFSLSVHNNVASKISRNGTDNQIERFLPKLMKGENIGAFCLTESGAGSDAAAITTSAKNLGEEWVLNGDKAWVTNGTVTNVMSVYAQTDPQQGWKGIACILVEDKTPGFQRGEAYEVLCGYAMGAASFTLEDCRVPKENLLLHPGEAFKSAMQGINTARAYVAAMCCGMIRAGLDYAIDYASDREVFGRPVTSFQGIQWQLADIATNLEAARLLTYHATMAIDRGEDGTVKAAHAKKFATRTAVVDICNCMEAMGAEGYKIDHPLARHLAAAKMAQYLDGTTEIMNVVISRAMLKGSKKR